MSDSTPARPATTGFTLIELLVVITIIVVLLALLVPALDRAVYHAELTACAAQLHALGSGLTQGAVENQRYYPERRARGLAISVNVPVMGSAASNDDRPTLGRYLGGSLNKFLNDPLTKAVDINGSLPSSSIQGSYGLWYSWLTGPGEQSMRKLGGRWTWPGGLDGARGTADDVEYSFSLLAQDYHQRVSTPYNLASHPDRDNILSQIAYTDAGGARLLDVTVAGGETTSGWLLWGGDAFGMLDMNAAYSDGAVLRYADVEGHPNDERMMRVPVTWNRDDATVDWYRVPRP